MPRVRRDLKRAEVEKQPDFHHPLQGMEGQPFQKDKYGDFKIVIEGVESRWYQSSEIGVLEVHNKKYIAKSAVVLYGAFVPGQVYEIKPYESPPIHKEHVAASEAAASEATE